jgi:AcrR family transcriptional regulator
MPTSTFFNLPEDKRQSLVNLALEEFANRDYDKASISKIVAKVGIAKGSIYQYFANKQDLYFYLVGLAAEKKKEFLAGLLTEATDVPVFTHLQKLFLAMLEFQQQYPLMAKLGNRILNVNSPLPKELLEKTRTAAQKQFSDLFEQRQATGEIRADVDPKAAGFIMSAVILEAGNQTDITVKEFERYYNQLVLILKNGMATPDLGNGEQ